MMNYTRQGDNLAVEERREELIEIRVSYGSSDEVLGYIYANDYVHLVLGFQRIAKARGGKLVEAVIENDDKYETFRALINEGN